MWNKKLWYAYDYKKVKWSYILNPVLYLGLYKYFLFVWESLIGATEFVWSSVLSHFFAIYIGSSVLVSLSSISLYLFKSDNWYKTYFLKLLNI